MKKKVMHLLYSSEFGGAEKVAINLIIDSKEITDSLYVSKIGGIKNKLEENNINFKLVNKFDLFTINGIINSNEIEVIHAHDFRASLVASFFRRKCKIISHIHQSPKWLSQKNLKTQLYKIRMKFFSSVLVTSKEIKESFPYPEESKKIEVFKNCVNTPFLKDINKKVDFLFIGRLEQEKNPEIFIEFIEDISNYIRLDKVQMIGNGSMFEKVEKIIKTKGLPITLLGFVDEPYQQILEAKFVVCTSEKEGFGISIVEAMQLGVPVITKIVGGVTEYLSDDNAVIIDDFKSLETFNKISEIYHDDRYYSNMKENSKIFGNQFRTNQEYYLKLKEIYSTDEKK